MGKMVYNTIESKLERKRTMSEPLVNVTRGPIVESVHYGDIAVVDHTGRLLAFAGDPYRVTYLRSAAKPLQALNVLLSGAADRFAFTDEELAIMCASHYGEDYHQKVIQGILEKLGLALSDLKCGAPYSISPWVYEQQLRDHVQLDTWNCDCSGKHAGFLATCLTKGYPLENYDRPEHPLQREVLKLVAHMCGVEPDSIYIGEDGCGVPVHGLPVYNMALGFARLARPEGLSNDCTAACGRIFRAMNAHPEMVEGHKGFVTSLMEATHGKLAAKNGAEGVFCVALKEQGIGIALKIEDGDPGRPVSPAVMRALEDLDLLTEEEEKVLSSFARKDNRGNMDQLVGEVVPAYHLHRVGQAR